MDEEPTRFEAYLQYGTEKCKANPKLNETELSKIWDKYFSRALKQAPEEAKASVKDCIKESTANIVINNYARRIEDEKTVTLKDIEEQKKNYKKENEEEFKNCKRKEKDAIYSLESKNFVIFICGIIVAVLWVLFRFKLLLPQIFSFIYNVIVALLDIIGIKKGNSKHNYYADGMEFFKDKFTPILLYIVIAIVAINIILFIYCKIRHKIISAACWKERDYLLDEVNKKESEFEDQKSIKSTELEKAVADFGERIKKQTSEEYTKEFFGVK